MLAVFDKTVAKSPEALQSSHIAKSAFALKDGSLASHFSSLHPGSVIINLGSSGFMSYSSDKQNPLLPRMFCYPIVYNWIGLIVLLSFSRLFAVVDDIFCLFEGHIENVAHLKQQYGLNKTANEVIIVIEAYRTLRDRGPYPADQVVRDIQGKFAFILYDSSSKATFIAADADGSVPFFWGTDSEGHLVLSDDGEVVKQGCGKSFAPFPKGCFFTSSGGLRSYEHPINELKAVPRVDSSGEVCGATFKVDSESKKGKTGMPRVGSDANWSQHI
ncbi:stem-specific TSJT1-like [Olea europaea subsp. europaea]|uniref:Stem-specific TSJT1-like n=1 Tax=Olea europaea subsp. europaea TaxID=158383 RepID=A0A8S0S2F5_OLEEU|nr:stem-specific TSJT1-like [Olea europaea subsp. europaea]